MLLGFALVSISLQAFGQQAVQPAPVFPWRLQAVPRTYFLSAPPATSKTLMQPQSGLPFRNWQDLLKPDSTATEPGRTTLIAGRTNAWSESGLCSIPLIEMELGAPFDKAMVVEMPPHPDDKMAIEPPPVCSRQDAKGKSSKRR